jgi:hypothetical protein
MALGTRRRRYLPGRGEPRPSWNSLLWLQDCDRLAAGACHGDQNVDEALDSKQLAEADVLVGRWRDRKHLALSRHEKQPVGSPRCADQRRWDRRNSSKKRWPCPPTIPVDGTGGRDRLEPCRGLGCLSAIAAHRPSPMAWAQGCSASSSLPARTEGQWPQLEAAGWATGGRNPSVTAKSL